MAIKGKIQFSLDLKPMELIEASAWTNAGSKFVDTHITSTECYGRRISESRMTTEQVEWQDTGGADDGYLNGEPFYVGVTTTSLASISGLTDIAFLYCKHTGYEYSSSSVLGDANTADYLEIRADSLSGQVIAVLAPGQCIALPFTTDAGVDSGDFFFQSATARLLAGANTIAMEFICVTKP
tara:strand:- start:19 stop:564 length:546 start_codon:yes stop_codon:yes gene_type:complete